MRKNSIVIIPAYNPNEKLLKLVENLKRNGLLNIIIVNDGCDDQYNKIFNKISEDKEIKVLVHKVNKGKGRALKTAFNYIINNYSNEEINGVITVDADGQHEVEDILKIDKALKCNKVILGVRKFQKDVPLRSKVGNELTKQIFKLFIGLNITDTQTGLRGIPIELLNDLLNVEGERYEYETNMLLYFKKESIAIEERTIKTVYIEDNKESHFNPIKDSIKIYYSLFKYSASSLCSFIIDNLVFFICMVLSQNVLLSLVSGRGISIIANYNINKRFVFKNQSKDIMMFVKYGALALINIVIINFVLEKLITLSDSRILIIKMLLEFILYFINFYIQKKFVFKNKEQIRWNM